MDNFLINHLSITFSWMWQHAVTESKINIFIFLFIFKDAVSSSEHIALIDQMLNEVEIIWKDAVLPNLGY